MTNFEKALDFVLEREGGVANHKNDRGGLTNYGVIQATYDQYRKGKKLNAQPVTKITEAEVNDIYKTMYWDAAGCENMEWPLGLFFFDLAVNSGVGRAIKWKALKVSGTAKEKTLQLIEKRRDFYRKIVNNNPTQKVFLRGWMNRMNHLQNFVEKT